MSHYFFQNQMKSESKSLSHSAGRKLSLCLHGNLSPALHGATWWSWEPTTKQIILKGLLCFGQQDSLLVWVDSRFPQSSVRDLGLPSPASHHSPWDSLGWEMFLPAGLELPLCPKSLSLCAYSLLPGRSMSQKVKSGS